MQYQDINAKTIDRWVEEGWEWGIPVSHEEYLAAVKGSWNVVLTPTKPVPHEWFGDLKGKKVLGLASGGGQQMPVFAECFRVLKHGGVLLSGLGNEVNYLVNEGEIVISNAMPFNPLVNEAQRKQLEDEDCGMQFSHTMEEQIGGQLKAGFVLTDIYGDTNGEGRLHEMNVETYVATRAIKL